MGCTSSSNFSKTNNPLTLSNSFEIKDTGHKNGVNSICFVDTNSIIATSYDKTISIIDIKTKTYKLINLHASIVRSICLVRDGLIASSSEDGTVKLWDSPSGIVKLIIVSDSNIGFICSIALVANDIIACGSSSGLIMLYDINTGNCIKKLTGHTNKVYSLGLLYDGSLVSGSADKSIKIWDLKSKTSLITTLLGHSYGVSVLCPLLSIGLASEGDNNGDIRIWTPNTPNWSTSTLNYTRILKGHAFTVRTLCQLPNGTLVSGSSDCSIKLWNLSNGECLKTLHIHTHWVLCIIAYPNESINKIASAGGDNCIYLTDLEEYLPI